MARISRPITAFIAAINAGMLAADISKQNRDTARTSRKSPPKSPNKTMTGGAKTYSFKELDGGSKRRRSVRRRKCKRGTTRRLRH